MAHTTPPRGHTMQCMEVWGGTAAADNGVVMPGLDAWIFARPSAGSDSGGDIHYLSSCATGRVVRLLLADVAGHGRGVAALAGELRHLLRRYLNYADQSALVTEINEELSTLGERGRFATAVIATCWTPTRRITLTNAGHPPPIHYDARRDRWSFLTDDPRAESSKAPDDDERQLRNIPLGITAADYDEHRLRLDTGDLLLIYSDALIEAQAPGGELLGSAGLLRILHGLDPTDPERLIAELRDAVRDFISEESGADDLTVMILRPNELRPRIGVLTGLRAGARIAADLARSLRPSRPFARPELTVRNVAGAFLDRVNGDPAE